jgi:4'-phosphopantetheinyl transferase EntD
MISVSIDFQMSSFQLVYMNLSSVNEHSIILLEEEAEQFKSLSNDKRKVEFLGVRFLRNSLDINEPIKYLSSGKPYLCSLQHPISISHCSKYIALAICAEPIGLDIELLGRNTSHIINKFVSEEEKILYKKNLVDGALELWCAKEAVYKLYDLQGLAFKDEITIFKRKKQEELILLEGTVQRNIPKREFIVKIARENDLLIAVATFINAPLGSCQVP